MLNIETTDLLEFVSEFYQKVPELLSDNDVIWTFVKFSGDDHSNSQTLVAFFKMLSTLACTAEGASKVFELLQGKAFRSIEWSTLFDSLSFYEEQFKHAVQSPGAVLPELQEGDAKVLVAYLSVLQKIVERGNSVERKNWFPDIEPLLKFLSYENVPPYLKGALRNAIGTFVHVAPVIEDTVWRYIERYDLQIYDMRCELNEIEARRDRYPPTISLTTVSGRLQRGVYAFLVADSKGVVLGPNNEVLSVHLIEKIHEIVEGLYLTGAGENEEISAVARHTALTFGAGAGAGANRRSPSGMAVYNYIKNMIQEDALLPQPAITKMYLILAGKVRREEPLGMWRIWKDEDGDIGGSCPVFTVAGSGAPFMLEPPPSLNMHACTRFMVDNAQRAIDGSPNTCGGPIRIKVITAFNVWDSTIDGESQETNMTYTF